MMRYVRRVFLTVVVFVVFCLSSRFVSACYVAPNNHLPGSPTCPDSIYSCSFTSPNNGYRPDIKYTGTNPIGCGILDASSFDVNDPNNPYCYELVSVIGVGDMVWCWANNLLPTMTPYPTPLPIEINCGTTTDINTQIGCIPADNPNDTAAWIFKRVFLIVSAIALFLMVSGGIAIATSAGNPDKVKHGRENITAALTGLIFIILAIFLLRLIGVDIIKIPGFAK